MRVCVCVWACAHACMHACMCARIRSCALTDAYGEGQTICTRWNKQAPVPQASWHQSACPAVFRLAASGHTRARHHRAAAGLEVPGVPGSGCCHRLQRRRRAKGEHRRTRARASLKNRLPRRCGASARTLPRRKALQSAPDAIPNSSFSALRGGCNERRRTRVVEEGEPCRVGPRARCNG